MFETLARTQERACRDPDITQGAATASSLPPAAALAATLLWVWTPRRGAFGGIDLVEHRIFKHCRDATRVGPGPVIAAIPQQETFVAAGRFGREERVIDPFGAVFSNAPRTQTDVNRTVSTTRR